MIERLFGLERHGTTIGREIAGGTATFMALSYIIFVQPAVLGLAGMDAGAVMVATCVCSAFACVLMGLSANLPIALAPAMGHNFFFALTVCGLMGWAWQEALAANLVAGVLFLLLAAAGFQNVLVRSMPDSLKYAVAVGIGLLITFVGLQWGGIVVHHPATYVKLGSIRNPVVLLTIFGLLVISSLLAARIRGAILWGVLITAAVGLLVTRWWGAQAGYVLVAWPGKLVSKPPSLAPTALGLLGGFRTLFRESWTAWISIIFVFLILDLFDTIGTLIGVSERAGLTKDGQIPRLRPALMSDAAGTIAGTLLGTSTITSYVESAAGVSAGARTGLAAIVTGLLLLASVFFYPLVQMVGAEVRVPASQLGAISPVIDPVACRPVIAPVLIIIGCYMLPVVKKIDWDDFTEAIPAFLTMVIMQFALSISHGIAWGFLSYTILKLVRGRVREIHPLLAVFSVLFAIFLITE